MERVALPLNLYLTGAACVLCTFSMRPRFPPESHSSNGKRKLKWWSQLPGPRSYNQRQPITVAFREKRWQMQKPWPSTHTFLLHLSSKDIFSAVWSHLSIESAARCFPSSELYWHFWYERECFFALCAAAVDTPRPNNAIENSFNSYWEVRSDRLTPFSLRTVCFVRR